MRRTLNGLCSVNFTNWNFILEQTYFTVCHIRAEFQFVQKLISFSECSPNWDTLYMPNLKSTLVFVDQEVMQYFSFWSLSFLFVHSELPPRGQNWNFLSAEFQLLKSWRTWSCTDHCTFVHFFFHVPDKLIDVAQ